jgi:TonB family protein
MSENWKQWPGQSVGGDFQLTEYLGGSANSATYLAIAPGDVKAAIKLITADPATAEVRLARWKIAESLSYPHLLKVFRSGRCELDGNDLLFVAMEYAEENISQVLPQRPLTSEEVRETLPPVLDALDYLHSNGLVHGRLKPGNIMAASDQLKLSTDGLLRNGEAEDWAGPYDAPEVPQTVSPASDIWSLGVTLVEVLTQSLPAWESGGTLPQLPETLPDQFRVIAQHCLIRDPNLRCKTADIRKRLKAQSVTAVPSPAAVPMPAPAPRRAVGPSKRFVIPAIAAVVIGAVVAIPRLLERTPIVEPTTAVTTPSTPPSAPSSPAPAVMSEATEPQPEGQKSEPEKNEAIQVVIPEKPSAAVRTPAVITPARPKAMETAPTPASSKQDSVVHQVLPDVPRKAMNTIDGKVHVRVKVQVDREGNVVNSEFVSPGPSKYFANLAMQAARKWKFSPSDSEARAWNLQFEFRRSGTTITPTQVSR